MSMDLAPARSRTDPPAPEQPAKPKNRERSHSYLHRRLHGSGSRHHEQNHNHAHRFRFPDTVQSAIELKPPISFDQVLRHKKSPDSSRRGSAQQQKDIQDWRAAQIALAEEAARKRVKPEDVSKAQAENDKRDQVLRAQLKGVEEIAMESTRKLDDTYYTILEKVSLLRSTVKQLQWLANESRKMHRSFEDDTKQLERETQQSLDSVGNFDRQEDAIRQLVERLQSSKDKTSRLNQRLDAVRNRVRVYEERQNARDSTRRRQWQATWGTLLGVLVLLVAILVVRNYDTVSDQLDGFGTTLRKVGESIIMEDALLVPDVDPVPDLDPRLQRLLDEL